MLRTRHGPSSSAALLKRHLFRKLPLLCALASSACGYVGIDFGTEEDDVQLVPGAGGSSEKGGGGKNGKGSGGEQPRGGGSDGDGDTGGRGLGGEDSLSSGGISSGGVGSGGETTGGSGAGTGGNTGTGGSANAECAIDDPLCETLAEALVHRYSFDGIGTRLTDTVGGADGSVRHTALSGEGFVILDGANDYVELPAGLLSSLANASLEIWIIWEGDDEWQKLFEFGATDAFSDPVNYLYVTTRAGGSIPEQRTLAAGLRHLEGEERQLRTTNVISTGVLTQIVLGVDDDKNRLILYRNGQTIAEDDIDVRLSDLRDDTNGLGSSLFSEDPYFQGIITEFRIYNAVLSPEAVGKSYALGEDAVYRAASQGQP